MKKNILLVALSFNDRYPPLGLANLKSYALKDIKIKNSFNISIESYPASSFKETSIFNSIERLNPEIIGFTVRSWCKRRVIGLSRKIKKKYPYLIVILGGPDINTGYLKNKYIDFIFHGRAELAFKEFLKYILGNKKIHGVPSISFAERGVVVSTRHASIDNLDDIPSPYLNQIIDLNRYSRPVLQTEFGCASNCQLFKKKYYCDIHEKDRKKRYFSLGRIKKEVYFISKRSNFLEIINCNLNLNKARFKEILNFLKKSSRETMEIILWLDYHAISEEDAGLIAPAKGLKILDFEFFIPKGKKINEIENEEIDRLCKAASVLNKKRIKCCLCILLCAQYKNSTRDFLRLSNIIKDKKNCPNLHIYLEYTK